MRRATNGNFLADALDLKRSLTESDLSHLSRVVSELQRKNYSLTSTQIVRAMVRGFVASQGAMSIDERVSAIDAALRVAPGGIS